MSDSPDVNLRAAVNVSSSAPAHQIRQLDWNHAEVSINTFVQYTLSAVVVQLQLFVLFRGTCSGWLVRREPMGQLAHASESQITSAEKVLYTVG